jgi:pyruvate dehydrogenase E1 component alpha subunit
MLGKLYSKAFHQFASKAFATATIKIPTINDYHRLDPKLLPTQATITTEECLAYYREMSIQRKVELLADQCYKNKEIRGFCHLYDGQEAVSVGLEAGITKKDHVITAYRCHGNVLSRGEEIHKVFAELLGRVTGTSKGKGGSMHYYMLEKRFYGGNGIVGAQTPVGTGVAFGIKYEGKKEVCITMYGDGSANQGQLFEAANMAKLWSLPVIYLCENNQYGMGTSCERASSNCNYFSRLDQVPGFRFDGMNVIATREAIKFAREWCISGKGPIALEAKTYRYHGHSMSDPGMSYRTRDEVTKMREMKDPIENLKSMILANHLSEEAVLKKIEKEVKVLVEAELEIARNAPWPDPKKELISDIYGVGNDKMFIRNVEYKDSQFPNN